MSWEGSSPKASPSILGNFLQYSFSFPFLKSWGSSRQKTFRRLESYLQEIQNGGTNRKHSKHREVKGRWGGRNSMFGAPRESHYLLLVYQSPPARQDTWVWSLGWENTLEKGMVIHSSILAWRIPMDRGIWQTTVHGVTKSWTQMSVKTHTFSSVQLLSHVPLFVTPWITACQASLSITISRSSLRLRSIESVMPSSHLILCHPLLLLPTIPPSIRVFSNESGLHMRWPEYWSFSFSIIPSK